MKKKGVEKVMLQTANKQILEDLKDALEKKWSLKGKKREEVSVEVRAVQ